MNRLIRFLKRYSVLFLFVALQSLVINYYVNSTERTKARTIAMSSSVTGGIRSFFASMGDWFSLRKDNRHLLERLARAEEESAAWRALAEEYARQAGHVALAASMRSDTTGMRPELPWLFTPARVVGNTVSRRNNFFILNRGSRHGVRPNMGVVSVDGAVAGYVSEVSAGYAVCVSVLSGDFRIGGRVQDKDYTGSVSWNGGGTSHVVLNDIPKYAPLEQGDTVVSAYSSRFPPGLPIGVIESIDDSPDGTTSRARVRLASRMARLSDVLLIDYRNAEELQELENRFL
jgi:rod shape-determining protein MreC